MKATTMTTTEIMNITGIATTDIATAEINEQLAKGVKYAWQISSITLSNNPKPMRMTQKHAEAIIKAFNQKTETAPTTDELETRLERIQSLYTEKFGLDLEGNEVW